jgi:hypothetical protein
MFIYIASYEFQILIPFVMIIFNKRYFFLTLLLLITEVLIALYVKSGFIRHYLGDFLVVILIYCFIISFFKIRIIHAAIGVLLFAYFIELLQYLNFVNLISLEDNEIANVVLGNYFDWGDMLSYTLGIVSVLLVEKLNQPTDNHAETEAGLK